LTGQVYLSSQASTLFNCFPRVAATAKSNLGEVTGVSLSKRERMISFSEGWVPVAMSQMSCLTQLAGSAAAMVVKMASVSSSVDLFDRDWLIKRSAPAFKRSPAPITAAAAGTPAPEAKMTLVPNPLEVPVAVIMSAPKKALAEPTESTATTEEMSTAGFISKNKKNVVKLFIEILIINTFYFIIMNIVQNIFFTLLTVKCERFCT
jgi:hypothetical protein